MNTRSSARHCTTSVAHLAMCSYSPSVRSRYMNGAITMPALVGLSMALRVIGTL